MSDFKIQLGEFSNRWFLFLFIFLLCNTGCYQNLRSDNGKPTENIVINDAVKLSATDPLTSILQKHRGKVVYVDVWATWCLPCLFEMPNSRKLREKLAGEDVIFVYLCVNSDNEQRWKKLITSKRMAGENYLLSAEQSTALNQKFNIKGIPRYMLFDQDGDAISEDAKRPGEPIVLKTIKELLNSG